MSDPSSGSIEYAEITTALRSQTWGPDTQQLFVAVEPDTIGDELTDAINRNEPWLAAALHALNVTGDTGLDDAQIAWLEAVADHRATHHIATRDPLGAIPVNRAEVDEFDQLLRQLHDTREGLVAIERYDLGIDL